MNNLKLMLQYAELAKVIRRNREGIMLNGHPNRDFSEYDKAQLTALIYVMKDVVKGKTAEFKKEFFAACGYPDASVE